MNSAPKVYFKTCKQRLTLKKVADCNIMCGLTSGNVSGTRSTRGFYEEKVSW